MFRCYLFVFLFNISRVKEPRRSIFKCHQTINDRGMSLRQKPKGIFMGRIRVVILIFPSMTLIVILSGVLGPVRDKWIDLDNNERRQKKLWAQCSMIVRWIYYEVGWKSTWMGDVQENELRAMCRNKITTADMQWDDILLRTTLFFVYKRNVNKNIP